MAVAVVEPGPGSGMPRHAPWVRISHGILTVSMLVLTLTGAVILMAHPRLYWGEAGNDLTPAFLELPISRNYQHRGYEKPVPFFDNAAGPVSAVRTYDIFNQNGWGRSLHFLAAWWLVLPGLIYLIAGMSGGHFRKHILPKAEELKPRHVGRDVLDHLRFKIPAATGGPQYGVLQKCSYALVAFVAAPLVVVTGLTMAPAVTGAFPFLLSVFGGYQSARTIHFFAFIALVGFVVVHVVMVAASGFTRQIRGITLGK